MNGMPGVKCTTRVKNVPVPPSVRSTRCAPSLYGRSRCVQTTSWMRSYWGGGGGGGDKQAINSSCTRPILVGAEGRRTAVGKVACASHLPSIPLHPSLPPLSPSLLYPPSPPSIYPAPSFYTGDPLPAGRSAVPNRAQGQEGKNLMLYAGPNTRKLPLFSLNFPLPPPPPNPKWRLYNPPLGRRLSGWRKRKLLHHQPFITRE